MHSARAPRAVVMHAPDTFAPRRGSLMRKNVQFYLKAMFDFDEDVGIQLWHNGAPRPRIIWSP